MSLTTSGAPCLTCLHASMCPHREEYLEMYKHRDQVMVKTGADGSMDNTTVSTETLTIFVEHRYLNGPGLEQLYNALGLSAPTYCCLVPQNRCPLTRPDGASYHYDYFDSPICNKWNSPLGYISSLCKHEDFQVHPQKMRHKRPFIPTEGPCKTCMHATGKKPYDYSMIAGTQYSAFAITPEKVLKGSTITIDEIISTQVMKGYSFSLEATGASEWTINSEEDKIILYYTYNGGQPAPKPGYWYDDAKLEELGMMREVVFAYGSNIAYSYPTNPVREPQITINGITTGVNRLSLQYSAGNTMAMRPELTRVPPKEGEIIDVGQNYWIYKPVQRNHGDVTTFVPKSPGYVVFQLAKGDIINFSITVPKPYVIRMETMSDIGSAEFTINHVRTTAQNDTVYDCQMVVGKGQSNILHFCFVDVNKVRDPETKIIEYRGLNIDNITLAERAITITRNDTLYVLRTRIKPNIFAQEQDPKNTEVPDPIPADQWNLVPPYLVIRPGYEMIGYTDKDGAPIDPNDQMYHQYVHFSDISTLVGLDITDNMAMASWILDLPRFQTELVGKLTTLGLDEIGDNDKISIKTEPDIKVVPDKGYRTKDDVLMPSLEIQTNSIDAWRRDIDAIIRTTLGDLTDKFYAALTKLDDNTKVVMLANNPTHLVANTIIKHPMPEEGDDKDDELGGSGEAENPDEFEPGIGSSDEPDDSDGPGTPAGNEGEDSGGGDHGNDGGDEAGGTPSETEVPVTPTTPDPGETDVPVGPGGEGTEPDGEDKEDSTPINPVTPANPSEGVEFKTVSLASGEKAPETPIVGRNEYLLTLYPSMPEHFFMADEYLQGIVIPVTLQLEKKPITVEIIFKSSVYKNAACGYAVAGMEDVKRVVFHGLNEEHSMFLEAIDNPNDYLYITLSNFENDGGCFCEYAKFELTGPLADYYTIEKIDTNVMIDIKATFQDDRGALHTDSWEANYGSMATMDLQIPEGINAFYQQLIVDWGSGPVVLGIRPADTNKFELLTLTEETLKHVNTGYSENAPKHLSLTLLCDHDINIVIDVTDKNYDKTAYCARCAGYVDTSTEEYQKWLGWVPDCLKYTPSN